MEKRAAILALALTLPLAIYGIPYAYASTQSTYAMAHYNILPAGQIDGFTLSCHAGDYASNYFVDEPPRLRVDLALLLDGSGTAIASGEQPNGWQFGIENVVGTPVNEAVYIICQSPVTVAGIGVPEFGSLYVAIALGAAAYFVLSRRFAGRPTTSAEVQA